MSDPRLLPVPDRQELLKMSDWQKSAWMEDNLTGKEDRVKTYQLKKGSQEFDVLDTKAPEVIRHDNKNAATDIWEKENYMLTWGEKGAMDEMLKRQKERPELGDFQGGFVQTMANVSPEQLEAYRLFKQRTELGDLYNDTLTMAGRKAVQVGESRQSVLQRVAQAEDWKTSEPARKEQVQAELKSLLADVNAPRIENNTRATKAEEANAETTRQMALDEDKRKYDSQKDDADRKFEIKKIELDNKAKMEKYEMDMEKWRQKNRQDSIGALIAGLATLGMGFAL